MESKSLRIRIQVFYISEILWAWIFSMKLTKVLSMSFFQDFIYLDFIQILSWFLKKSA